MLLECHETKTHELSVLPELFRLDAAKHLNLLASQLEGGLLELKTLTRSVRG